jgi:hypothetical protein
MSDKYKGKLPKWAYAKRSKVHTGTCLVCDGGFTCMKNRQVVTVKNGGRHGLYVECGEGRHYLDGQFSEDGATPNRGLLRGLLASCQGHVQRRRRLRGLSPWRSRS